MFELSTWAWVIVFAIAGLLIILAAILLWEALRK
jgi:hypothetical protein